MRAELLTRWVVVGLIGASVVCVGGRHAIKAANSEANESSPMSRADNRAGREEVVTSSATRSRAKNGGDELREDLGAVLETINPTDRTRALLTLVDRFNPGEWPALLDVAHDLFEKDWPTGLDLLLVGWAERNSDAAFEWALANDHEVGKVIDIWAKTEPENVIGNIMASDASANERTQMLSDVLEVYPDDPATFSSLLARVSTEDRKRVLARTQITPESVSVVECREWIDGVPPESRQDFVISMMRTARGMDQRLSWLEAYPSEPPESMYLPLYPGWIGADSEAAMSFLKTIESDGVRRQALNSCAYSAATMGEADLSEEIIERFPDTVDDRMIHQMIVQFPTKNSDDCRRLMEWIDRIQGKSYRARAYGWVFRRWKNHDHSAMKAWMAENDVPDLVRRQLEE